MRRLILVQTVRPGKRKLTTKSGEFINFMLKCNYQIVPLVFGTKYSRMDQAKFVEDSL